MQKTKILISALNDGLAPDVTEIELFIRRLNDCYLDRGHYFSLVVGDSEGGEGQTAGANGDPPYGIAAGGDGDLRVDGAWAKQLTDCALAIFLTDVNMSSKAYKAAVDCYEKSGSPKISVYGRATAELASNARQYSHIDTLKLEVLMLIRQLGLDGVHIQLRDGKAWQGDEALMPLDNVEAVSGYENLQNLKHRHEELERAFYAAKALYAERPDDGETYEAFVEASRRRSEAVQEIQGIEAQLYNMMEGMYEQTSKGKLTTRQAEGYRLIERGLLSEARDVLDFYSIMSDSRRNEETAEQTSKRAQDYVNELMQLKDVNAALQDWEGVDECFKEAVRLVEKHGLQRNAAYEYARHLRSNFKYIEALEQGEKLLRHYESKESGSPDRDKARVYSLLGGLYAELARMEEAESAIKAGLKLLQATADSDRDYIDRSMGVMYHNLGLLYDNCMRHEEALESYEAALGIRVGLAAGNSVEDEEYLATTYLNLSCLNNTMGKYEAAIEYSQKALSMLTKLAVSKPDPNEMYLTMCISNFCDSYLELQQYDKAEEQLGFALATTKRLAEQNPDKYALNLASVYHDYGNLFKETKRFAQAEEKYDDAMRILKRLTGRSPEYFEPMIAACCSSFGELYTETRRFAEAEGELQAAISLFEKYAGSNPGCADKAGKAQEQLNGLKSKQLRAEGAFSHFSDEEKEIALLLTEGKSRSQIIRKLDISAVEYSRRVGSLREKVSGAAPPDPVVDAVVLEYKLTQREADMMHFLRDSASTERIAAELFITEDTVRSHVYSLLKKLGMEKRQDVPAWLDGYEGLGNH